MYADNSETEALLGRRAGVEDVLVEVQWKWHRIIAQLDVLAGTITENQQRYLVRMLVSELCVMMTYAEMTTRTAPHN